MRPTVLPSGPRALLLEFASLDEVMAADRALTRSRLTESGRVAEVVPAARTILLVHDGSVTSDAVLDELDAVETAAVRTRGGDVVEIPVRYDGADLAAVADSCRMSTEEVVARHSAALYECAFCGFMPGFSYLTGLDPELWLPRLATPRTRVPAGSVAIAAGFSAVYPAASPGGWHLLGTTSVTMWDPTAESPALVTPGCLVRFVVA